MDQTLHLLIVDRDSGTACATDRAGRWMVPMLVAPERARPGPLVAAWAAGRGLAGQFAGQWLGRMAPSHDAVDWLAVFCARNLTAPLGLQRLPLDALVTGRSWIDYQTWAIQAAVGRNPLPHVAGPFGSVGWIDDVLGWVGQVAPDGIQSKAIVAPARATSHEVSLSIDTGRERLYFKGASQDRASELTAQIAVARWCPASFPRTLAAETRADGSTWWLMTECPGVPLAGTIGPGAVGQVVHALANVQRRLPARLPCDQQAILEIDSLTEWAGECVEQTGQTLAPASLDALRGRWNLLSATTPMGWIPTDVDPSNVLIAGDNVRFVDVGESFRGPVPLALAGLARRLKPGGRWSCDAREIYERAWTPPLTLEAWWPLVECMSLLIECRSSWTRVVASHEQGEIYGLLDHVRARLATRVVRATVEFERQSR